MEDEDDTVGAARHLELEEEFSYSMLEEWLEDKDENEYGMDMENNGDNEEDDNENDDDEFSDSMLKEWQLPPDKEEEKTLTDELDNKEKENEGLKRKIQEMEIKVAVESINRETAEKEVIEAQETIHRLLNILEKEIESKRINEAKKDFVSTPAKVMKMTEGAVAGAKVNMMRHQMIKNSLMNPQQRTQQNQQVMKQKMMMNPQQIQLSHWKSSTQPNQGMQSTTRMQPWILPMMLPTMQRTRMSQRMGGQPNHLARQ